MRPLTHFARGVLIGRTGSANVFDPYWAMIHLFEAGSRFHFDFGDLIANSHSPHPGFWSMEQPGIAEALIEAIEHQALPKLRAVTTLDDYLAFVSRHMFRHKLFDWPSVKIIVDVAQGDLAAARRLRDAHRPEWDDDPSLAERIRDKRHRLRALCALLDADDRPGLAALLHDWEAITVRNFRIEKFWTPTPFPLELPPPG
ncbi:hypothetical protein [Aquabacter spiritensis]|nr:hypothetical protein [Aquabacter spiritensis]